MQAPSPHAFDPVDQPLPSTERSTAERGEAMLDVRNLRKGFNGRVVLEDISFDVYSGETLGIVGPSGCGKSTILKLLTGLLEPDGGRIIKKSNDISLVFQSSALLNSLTVRENLALALRHKHMSKTEENKVIAERLNMVGLGDFINAYPPQLSGGQQKRTGFARAIVSDPKIILYDEPTTGLDPVMSTVIEDYMIDLENRLKAASIVVTHQYSTWMRTAHRIILMHAGRIEWQGTPEEAVKSDNPYMQQFAHASRQGPMSAGSL
jgi:phospholipid/cholesterol/gamma-HCH transport system ATP-binding protein